MTFADGVGVAGAATIVVTYFLLQTGRVQAQSLAFSAANGFGAAAILYSLVFDFNLSAFAIEAFWLAISILGFVRAVRVRRHNAAKEAGTGSD